MPHSWAKDSEHAEEVRRARGEGGPEGSSVLKIAAIAGLAYFGLKLIFGSRRHA